MEALFRALYNSSELSREVKLLVRVLEGLFKGIPKNVSTKTNKPPFNVFNGGCGSKFVHAPKEACNNNEVISKGQVVKDEKLLKKFNNFTNLSRLVRVNNSGKGPNRPSGFIGDSAVLRSSRVEECLSGHSTKGQP